MGWAGERSSGSPRSIQVETRRQVKQLGTLGGGDHFIEVCLDTEDCVWVMLHSGSRGDRRPHRHALRRDRQEGDGSAGISTADREMSYLSEGTQHLPTTWRRWVGRRTTRAQPQLMLDRTFVALHQAGMPKFEVTGEVVNCHHNYVAEGEHFGREVYLTRKGAVARVRGDGHHPREHGGQELHRARPRQPGVLPHV